MNVHGLHHITALSSDAQLTYDFYTNVLGLRLVKKSVNQDDVLTYHLFFGNKFGSPGFDVTFFPFKGAPKGNRGAGQVTTISFAVPSKSLMFWKKRFEMLKILHEEIREQFGFKRLIFYDNDEQQLELVEMNSFEEDFEKNVWETDDISKENAIRCFHGATLSMISDKMITPVLEVLGYKLEKTEGSIHSYKIPARENAAYLIIDEVPLDFSVVNGYGTVHHIAFSVTDKTHEAELRDKLIRIGQRTTDFVDRYYFMSVYFRTPAGILFELATEGPGFTADEDAKALGEKLALPPFLESQREVIEANLEPIHL